MPSRISVNFVCWRDRVFVACEPVDVAVDVFVDRGKFRVHNFIKYKIGLRDGVMYKTKTEHAYEVLKSDIIGGRYHPEEPLRLHRLSKDVKVSIVPIREALLQLERERLLVQIPHQGYSVAPMSMSEFEELVTLRRNLEEMIIPLVLANSTEEQLDNVAGLVGKMRSYLALEEASEDQRVDHAAFVALNKQFHLGIAKASGYTHLPPMLGNILDLSQRYLNTIETRFGIRQIDIDEHEAILDAIREKESAKLKSIYEQHYQRILDEFTSYMAGRRTSDSESLEGGTGE